MKKWSTAFVILFSVVLLSFTCGICIHLYMFHDHRTKFEYRTSNVSSSVRMSTAHVSPDVISHQWSTPIHKPARDHGPNALNATLKLNNGKEVKHIAFLKVHKAASTTAQNLFLRFGNKHDATFVLRKPPYMYPNIISLSESLTVNNILPPPTNRTYDILCCHVIYNRVAFENIMPEDTVYIGLVRHPFELFKSILNYFRPPSLFNLKIEKPITNFLRNPMSPAFKAIHDPKFSFLNNRMAFEYDFPTELFKTRDDAGIHHYIQKLDKEFDLVIVVEKFDESIVLMRRLLNWKMKDILFLPKNIHGKVFEKIQFEPGDVRYHKRWAKLDYALYSHFYSRLLKQMLTYADFNEELFYFKALNADVALYCKEIYQVITSQTLKGNVKNIKEFKVTQSNWSDPFTVTADDCASMRVGEIKEILKIQYRQYGNLTKNKEVYIT